VALQRQTPTGWPNRPRKVGEPDGLLLLRVDRTIVRLVVSNPLETAHAVPRHCRGRGVRGGRLQRSGSQSLAADSPRGRRRPEFHNYNAHYTTKYAQTSSFYSGSSGGR
jgi:hypothetical protein